MTSLLGPNIWGDTSLPPDTGTHKLQRGCTRKGKAGGRPVAEVSTKCLSRGVTGHLGTKSGVEEKGLG